MSAPRNAVFLSFIRSLVVGVLVLAACTEATSPIRRFPVLTDIGSSDWQMVSVGGDHTCALTTDGSAYCWGSNRFGQLGLATTDTICGPTSSPYPCTLAPRAVQAGTKFVSISAGQNHTCAITASHDALCWGNNDNNQLTGLGLSGPSPVLIPKTLPWEQISAGVSHTCAVRSDGVLFCWGENDRGEIGNGNTNAPLGPVKANVPGLVASVTTGQERTCARTNVGVVYCWGAIWTGHLNGLDFTRQQLTPQLVPSAPALSSVTVGAFTTCGTDLQGLAYCWEGNPRGGGGNGTVDGSTTPFRVSISLPFVQISSGLLQTCGIAASGAGYCWGDNSFGQLGVSSANLVERCDTQSLPCSTRPIAVLGQQQFVSIATGPGSHTCGVTTRGNLYCWGLGASGQRGDGTTVTGISTPLLVKR